MRTNCLIADFPCSHELNLVRQLAFKPITVAARSEAWVCGRSLAGIAGSNPARGMDEYILRMLCFVRYTSLRRADLSSRGVIPESVRVSFRVMRRNGNPLHLHGVQRGGQTNGFTGCSDSLTFLCKKNESPLERLYNSLTANLPVIF